MNQIVNAEVRAIDAYYKKNGWVLLARVEGQVRHLERCLFKTLVGMLRAGVDL